MKQLEFDFIKKPQKKGVRHLVMLTVDELIKIIEKDPSKQMIEYQDEIIRKGKIIGSISDDWDGDLLTGNLREDGVKVYNINEQIRRERMKKKKEESGG